MLILVIVGVVLLIAFVVMLRHSRNFRGYGKQYADEERPEIRLSKVRGPEGGGWM